MRKFLIAIGSIICFHSFGQTAVKGTFSGGILLPIGESAETYTFGVELAGGATVQKDRVTLGLDLAGEYFQNNPPSSSISDRLILFGPSLTAGWSITLKNLRLVPFVNIGYRWGINSITDGQIFPENSIDLINLNGISWGPGLSWKLGERASISVNYLFFSPSYTLTQEAQNSITINLTPTQLYGPVVNFPEDSFTMDRISFRFAWTL